MTTRTMRRWELSAPERDNLRLDEVPVPEPASDELLVKVGAVSPNSRDERMIEGGLGGVLPWLSPRESARSGSRSATA